MKKISLLAIFSILSFSLIFSQARIGFTEREIRDEFNYLKWSEKLVGIGLENKAIFSKVNNFIIQYIFDYYDRCAMTVLIPLSEKELNDRISKYNKNCKKLYENHWIDNSNIHIELLNDGQGYYFIYWMVENKEVLVKS